jgi:hypothetical protein
MWWSARLDMVCGMDDYPLPTGAGRAGGPSAIASYARSLLVAVGWYATIVAAVVVGALSVPAAPARACSPGFGCLPPGEGLFLVGVVFGVPVLAGLLITTSLVNVLVVRLARSAILAGTLSAVASVGVAGALTAIYLGTR